MADTTYTVSYDTSSAVKAGKNIDTFTASVVKHDAAVASDLAAVKKLTAAYNDLATAAGKAAKMIDKAAASTAAATAQSNAFAASVTGAAVASLDLEKGANTAATATAKAGRALDKAGASAKAAAVGIDAAAMAARASNIPIGAMGAAASTAGSKFRAFGKAASTATTNLGNTTAAANTATTALNGTAAAGTAAKAGLQGVGKGASGAIKGVDGLKTSLTGLVSTAVALGVLRKVVGELGDAIKEARDFDRESAEGNFGMREQARELAFNMGENGPNDKVMGRVFGTAIASGMSFKEALAHNQELEGSIVAGQKAGHVREDQKEEIAKVTAILARRSGLDAKTMGDMAGVVLQDMNVNTDKDGKPISAQKAAEMVGARLDSMVTGNAEGRGSVSTLAKGEISTGIASVSSGHTTWDEMTGLMSTASNYAKSAAGTGVKISQIENLIHRPDEATKELMREAGIKEGTGTVGILQGLRAHLDKKAAEAKAEGKPFSESEFLYGKGMHLDAAKRSLISMLHFTGSKDKPGILEKQIADSKARSQDLEGTKARNAAYLATGPAQHDIANAKVETATYEHGKKTQNLVTARLNAVAQLIDEGSFKEKTQLMADKVRTGFGLAEFAGLPSGEQQRIDERVAKNALAAAKEAGKPVFDREIQNESGLGTETKESLDLSASAFNQEQAVNFMKMSPEATARVLNDLEAKGVPIVNNSGIAAKQKSADRDPAKAAAWEAAKQAKPGVKPAQPVDLKATPREIRNPILPKTPDGKQFGVVDASPAPTAGGASGATVVKVEVPELTEAARMLMMFAQTANQPPLLGGAYDDYSPVRT